MTITGTIIDVMPEVAHVNGGDTHKNLIFYVEFTAEDEDDSFPTNVSMRIPVPYNQATGYRPELVGKAVTIEIEDF